MRSTVALNAGGVPAPNMSAGPNDDVLIGGLGELGGESISKGSRGIPGEAGSDTRPSGVQLGVMMPDEGSLPVPL
jgi:hypothetical protein